MEELELLMELAYINGGSDAMHHATAAMEDGVSRGEFLVGRKKKWRALVDGFVDAFVPEVADGV